MIPEAKTPGREGDVEPLLLLESGSIHSLVFEQRVELPFDPIETLN
jgi:hypothetical protein